MSALPPKADIDRRDGHVRLVPKADICSAANCTLFNHLVGGDKQSLRYREAERLGSPEIDHQFELGRQLYGNDCLGAETNPL